MVVLIFVCSVILVGIIILIIVKNRKNRVIVETTSPVIKKIHELNSKFPEINTNYNHNIVERVDFTTRRSAVNFDPSKTFSMRKPELRRIATTRINNAYLYGEYKKLFLETIKNVKTDDDIINSVNLKPNKYRKIESKIVIKLFKIKIDNEKITFQVYSHYVSPQGRSTYNSAWFKYSENDFAYDITPRKIFIDYVPYIDKNKEEINSKTVSKVTGQKDNIQEENKALIIKINDISYQIEDNIAEIIEVNKDIKNIKIPAFIQVENSNYPVKSIKSNIFTNNKNIEIVSIEDGIEIIDSSAFKNCYSLINVTLPSTLKEIHTKTFSGCVKMQKIIIPSSVTHIEEEAFSLCSNLIDIYIPSSVKYIGPSAFWYSIKAKIHMQSGCDISQFDPDWNVDNNEVIFEKFN